MSKTKNNQYTNEEMNKVYEEINKIHDILEKNKKESIPYEKNKNHNK